MLAVSPCATGTGGGIVLNFAKIRDTIVGYLEDDGDHREILGVLRKLDTESHKELAALAEAAKAADRKERHPFSPLKAILALCDAARVAADGDDPDKETLFIDCGGYEYIESIPRTYSRLLEDTLPSRRHSGYGGFPPPPPPGLRGGLPDEEWRRWREALNDPMCSKYSWSAEAKADYIRGRIAALRR